MRANALTHALLCTCIAVAAAPPDPDSSIEAASYRAHIAACDAQLRLNEPTEARRWWADAPAAYRNWEWRYLGTQLDQTLDRRQVADQSTYGFAISPDATRLAICGVDQTIRILDAATLRELRQLCGHTRDVHCVAFSPDGRRIVSASQDGTARVWDVESGAEQCVFRGHENPVGAVAFGPDGRQIASSSYVRSPQCIDGQVFVWEPLSDGAPRVAATLVGGAKPLVALQFSPDGRRIAAGSWGGAVFIWSVENHASPLELRIPDGPRYNAIDGIAFSPDGAQIAVGSKDRTARVWDSNTGEPLATLTGHGGYVVAVAFSPNGRLLATGGDDDLVRFWDTGNWEQVCELRGHHDGIRAAVWSPKAPLLYTASVMGEVCIWDARPETHRGIRMTHAPGCYATLFSPDGKLIYACNFKGMLAIFDARTGERRAKWRGHPEDKSCHALSLTNDGRRLFSASYDRTIKIWDTSTQQQIGELTHDAPINHAAATGDGRFAAATQCATVWLWDMENKSHFATVDTKAVCNEVAFSHDGKLLATSGRDGVAHIWRTADGQRVATLRGHMSGIMSSSFSRDDQLVATGGNDGARVWNPRTGELIRTVHSGDDAINRVCWSPDGTRIAAASQTLMILDAQAGGVRLRIAAHDDTLWHLSFSPDGEQIASCSWDGTIAITDARRDDSHAASLRSRSAR